MTRDSTRTIRVMVTAVLVLSVVVPAGLGASVAPATAADGDGKTGGVAFARTIEEMKGHLVVSIHFAKAGELDVAAQHANHPIREYWSVAGPRIRNANATLAERVRTKLDAASRKVRNLSASEYEEYVRETLFPLLNRAKRAVVEANVSNSTFAAKVVRELLQRTAQEYREGVNGSGAIVKPVEYWDAWGFLQRARDRYTETVRSALPEHGATEVDEMFATLQSAVDASKPPAAIRRLVRSISSEFSEYLGIAAQTGGGRVSKIVAEIEERLHRAVQAYANGNPAKAKRIIHQTYLSYFEGLEGPLIEKSPTLVRELEAAFNEELPGLIERNASVSEVRQKVESMEEKLQRVEELLTTKTETTIDLEDETPTPTVTATETPTATATPTTASQTTAGGSDGDGGSPGMPGFGAGVAIAAIALVGALLTARTR